MTEEDKDKTILDFGCGNGILAAMLLDEGYDVYVIDASVSGIAIARQKYPERFFVHDLLAESLPADIEKIRFDLIVSTEVIEHLYAPRTYMRLLRRIFAERRGEVIISMPYHGYWKNLALAVTNRMDSHFTVLWDGGHVKFWSRRTLTRLLNEFGFEVTQFHGSGRLPLLWKSMFVRAQLSNDVREVR